MRNVHALFIAGSAFVAFHVLVTAPSAQVGLPRMLWGIVLAEDSREPIAGVTVEFSRDDSEDIARASSNSAGRFDVLGVTAAGGVLAASAPGYATLRQKWTGEELDVGSVLLLSRAAEVSGTLRARDGSVPMDGVVTIITRSKTNLHIETIETSDGTYRYDSAVPGPALLIARAAGHAPVVLEAELTGGRSDNRSFVLDRGAVIEGRVVDESGQPIAGAEISVEYGSVAEYGHGITRAQDLTLRQFVGGSVATDEDGRYRLTGIAPRKRVRVLAESGSDRSEKALVIVQPGATAADVELSIRRQAPR